MKNDLKKNNIISIEVPAKDDKMFSWMLFETCNYHCSYCLERNLKRTTPNVYNLIKTAKKIHSIYKLNQFNFLSVLGGELSILNLKDFICIMEPFLNEKELYFEYITNFSANNEYYLEIIKNFNVKKFTLKTSLHSEFVDIDDFFKKILNMYSLLLKNNIKNVIIKIEYVVTKKNKKNIEKILKLFSKLERINKKIFFLRLEEEFAPYIEKKDKYFWNDKKWYNFEDVKLKYNIKDEYLNQERKYIITKNNKKNFYGEIIDITNKKNNNIICTNTYCVQKSFFLEHNKLYRYCTQKELSDDFLNCDPLKIDYSYAPYLCKRKICSEVFYKIFI